MTRLIVIPGSCGYNVSISVVKEQEGPKKFRLSMETDCKHVKLLAEDIPFLDMAATFAAIIQNPVYQAASRRLKHPACPVPCAILKVLEVEAGLNVAKDISFEFEREK